MIGLHSFHQYYLTRSINKGTAPIDGSTDSRFGAPVQHPRFLTIAIAPDGSHIQIPVISCFAPLLAKMAHFSGDSVHGTKPRCFHRRIKGRGWHCYGNSGLAPLQYASVADTPLTNRPIRGRIVSNRPTV